jgi:hypothetical protein
MAQAAATLTPSSPIMAPIQVNGVAKVPARRAPNLSEHADEILSELVCRSSIWRSYRNSDRATRCRNASVIFGRRQKTRAVCVAGIRWRRAGDPDSKLVEIVIIAPPTRERCPSHAARTFGASGLEASR